MKFEFFVALRYLRARRKQVVISFISLISVLGIMTGVAALIIVLSLYSGMTQDIQNKILGATAHVTVMSRDSSGIADYQAVARRLKSLPDVRQVSPAIFVQGLVSSGGFSSGIVLKGVDPKQESRIIDPYITMKWGRLAALTGGRNIVLGEQIARHLRVVPGSTVTVIVPQGTLTPMGLVPRIHRFRVVGVFETGLFDLDNNWAFLSLDQARRLAGLPPGTVQSLELRIRDIYNVTAVQDEISGMFGQVVATQNWIETNRPLFSALKLEKWGMFLAIGLIVMVAALNIITTLIMMVMEKSRDIAILRAMGATVRQIRRIFVWQGLVIGLVGTLLGAGLGVGLSLASDRYHWFHLDAQVYMIPYLPFRVSPWDVLMVSASALLISFLATLYPSRQAARIDPVEAIRYE